MPHLSDDQVVFVSKVLRRLLPKDYGYVLVTVDLKEGKVSLTSDAPDQDLVENVLKIASESIQTGQIDAKWITEPVRAD